MFTLRALMAAIAIVGAAIAYHFFNGRQTATQANLAVDSTESASMPTPEQPIVSAKNCKEFFPPPIIDCSVSESASHR